MQRVKVVVVVSAEVPKVCVVGSPPKDEETNTGMAGDYILS